MKMQSTRCFFCCFSRRRNFNGTVQATDFLDKNGDSMMSSGKFKNDFLDLGNIKLNGQSGDIAMTGGITMDGNISLGGNINFGNAGSITWGKNAPVKYQFAVSATGPWHNPAQAADKYRRDSLDGGITWGAGYQFVATDGRPGSDANVPGYIKETYIDSTRIESPTIVGGLIRGGRIESDSTINITTNAKIGEKLTINAANLKSGIEFVGDVGGVLAEIYMQADTGSLRINSEGSIWINNEEWPPVAKFG